MYSHTVDEDSWNAHVTSIASTQYLKYEALENCKGSGKESMETEHNIIELNWVDTCRVAMEVFSLCIEMIIKWIPQIIIFISMHSKLHAYHNNIFMQSNFTALHSSTLCLP